MFSATCSFFLFLLAKYTFSLGDYLDYFISFDAYEGTWESELLPADSHRRLSRSSRIQSFYNTLRPGQSPLYTDVLHRCRDGGEVYSAAYLITKEHLLYQYTDHNLTWVNCEMGSFIMMNGRVMPHKNVNGSLMQSRDVLDFSVIHLSAYERLLLRWSRSAPEINADKNNITTVALASELIQSITTLYHRHRAPAAHSAFNRTVVVMPYLGVDRGAGHSKLFNRQVYLSACFWSFYQFYPYIVAGVKSVKDRDYILKSSGLPFYDVMLLENLPKSASIPVATVQETKRRIISGSWNFDYIFFTESDQILMMRIPDQAYEYLDHFPRHLVVPHRLMAYPAVVVKHFHKREISCDPPLGWMDKKCLLPLQYCTDRKEWVHVSNETVPILNVYGIQVPLGNSDFHKEFYRACRLEED